MLTLVVIMFSKISHKVKNPLDRYWTSYYWTSYYWISYYWTSYYWTSYYWTSYYWISYSSNYIKWLLKEMLKRLNKFFCKAEALGKQP